MPRINNHKLAKVLFSWVTFTTFALTSLSSQGAPASNSGQPDAPRFNLNLSGVHQGDSELEDSNAAPVAELQRSTWATELSANVPIDSQWSLGSSIKYEHKAFDWVSLTAASLATDFFDNKIAQWQSVKQYSASVALTYRLNERWIFLLSPQIKYAYADSGRASDAQSYGLVFSAMRGFSGGNVLGLGVVYLNDLNDVSTMPYLAVRWQLNDKWLLSNPFKPGFSGPAGLELSYGLSPNLDVGFGASMRRERFAIGAREQSIELQEWLGFTRVSWQLNSLFEVSTYGGYFFNGEMESSVNDVRYDLAGQWATGMNVSLRF